MILKTIIYEKQDGIGIVTLNRPERKNALNNELIRELDLLIEEIKNDNELGAIIITGNKDAFCAGADITEVSAIKTPVDAHRFVTNVHALFGKIENLEKPIIAAISGLALGGGCELSLACDIRIAAENAIFGQPEIKIGVIPGGGGTQRLPRLIGVGRAKELLYIGDPISAEEAYRIGLVNKVVLVKSLINETRKIANKLKNQPSFALKIIKTAINHGVDMDIQSALAHEARCFEIIFSTDDQKEGTKAFLEKRKPSFKGK
jgi:enoyl-CoA hydratase